jgi:diguanylate cyclase (GGDEF)-like protein
LSFWVIDAAIDYFFSQDESFLSVVIFNKKAVAVRLLFSFCLLAFGVFVYRASLKQKQREITLLNEIRERKRIEEELYALSVKDELTGLYNRRGFFTLIEQQLRLADRLKRRIFMLYADLDNLKAINDTYGHQEGDLALIEIAKILRNTFRESDIIARIGGDEFVAIPVGITGETNEIITARISKNLEIHNGERKRSYSLSLSFGLIFYNPMSPCSIDELLAQVDKLMYDQKKQRQSQRKSRKIDNTFIL